MYNVAFSTTCRIKPLCEKLTNLKLQSYKKYFATVHYK